MKCSTVKKLAVGSFLSFGVSVAAMAAEVEFVNAFNINMNYHGAYWRSESFQVVVDNISSNKQVFVHRELEDGSWIDIPMYFDGKAGQNKEIWRVGTGMEDVGSDFVIKMVAGGVEYWDNNSGQNYQLDYGYTLGNTNEVVVNNIGSTLKEDGTLDVYTTIVVDNIGYDKQVELVYTNDDWVTSEVIAAKYAGPQPVYGYGSYPNPSASGAEAWHANFNIDPSAKHKFFVKYTVNGQSYYANNYGLDYTINFDSTFESMHMRTGPSWDPGRPMTLIDDNLWVANFGINLNWIEEMKFDVYNDWTVNFGDDNADGIANAGGANIPLPVEPGSYRVYFDDSTNVYSFEGYGVLD